MTYRLKTIAAVACATSILVVMVAAAPAPAFAQDQTSPAETYRDGVHFGRTLMDVRQCPGSGGDYHDGCVDGVTESQFDREADQALQSDGHDARQADPQPLLSPPAGLFHDPFSKPGDSTPPNN